MSRLSIKSPLRPRLGIALGATSLAAVRLTPRQDGWSVDWARHSLLPEALFQGEPQAQHETALAETLTQLVGENAHDYQPVFVALPDAAASFAIFAFDALPSNDAARLALVHWSFENDRHLRAGELVCAYQVLGMNEGKYLVYACAHEKRWLATVQRAFEHAAIVPWTIDCAVRFHFNRLQDHLSVEPQSAAVVIIGLQTWTLIAWDSAWRPRLVRSRWLATPSAGSQDEVVALAREIERTLQAFAHNDARSVIGRLYLSGSGPFADNLNQALNARTHTPVTRIDPCTDLVKLRADTEVPALETGAALVAAATR